MPLNRNDARKLAGHVATVGELRSMLACFTDDCPLVIDRQETGEGSVCVQIDMTTLHLPNGGTVIIRLS